MDEKCPYIISLITEFIGTGLLTFIGCMSGTYSNVTWVAFGFGIVILAMIQTFGHISPVHINPAVTLGVFILGKMHWIQALVYVVAQYIGAMVGLGLLKAVIPEKLDDRLCVLGTDVEVTVGKGFFVELAITFVFFMTIAGAIHPRNKDKEDSTPIRIGLTFTGLVFAAAKLTGAGLNPARALAPAIFANVWKEVWLYEIGPFAGMALAAALYRFVLDPNEQKSFYVFAQKKGI